MTFDTELRNSKANRATFSTPVDHREMERAMVREEEITSRVTL